MNIFSQENMMQNDLVEGVAPFTGEDIARIPDLATFTMDRFKAEKWALRDCKFLIYDNDHLRTYGYESDDEESMIDVAMKLSQAGGPERVEATDIENDGTEETPEKTTCSTCSRCPEFPSRHKCTKFRLFRPTDEPEELDSLTGEPKWSKKMCIHYVAVSYCWPIPRHNNNGDIIREKRSYQVRDLDGTVRPNRALDHVLDRAVNVANTFGLRLIWIDQECLPQPAANSSQDEKDYQQIGIQSMDLVYNRAIVTAGLHDVELTEQAELDALSGQGTRRYINNVINPLYSITQDRWYTRAWVAQEAFSAGSSLVLVFKRGPGLSFSSMIRRDQRFGVPTHSLDTLERKHESQVICIAVDDFRNTVRDVKALVQSHDIHIHNGMSMMKMGPDAEVVMGFIEAVEKLHPPRPRTNARALRLPFGVPHKELDAVDAVAALSLLRTRKCRDDQDMIAIMANMCGYEKRLDIEAVAKNCGSLRLALLTLALMNGDYSLFVPEAFPTPVTAVMSTTPPSRTVGSHTWTEPFSTMPDKANYIMAHQMQDMRVQACHAARHILEFPAYIWIVDQQVHLSTIRDKWLDQWASMKSLSIRAAGEQGGTRQEMQQLMENLASHFGDSHIADKAKYEIQKNGSLARDSSLWGGFNSEHVKLGSHFSITSLQNRPLIRKRVIQIVIAILRHLWTQSDRNPRAGYAATSIWQSVRADEVDGMPPLPDVVDESFFCHPSILNEDFNALQLDPAPDGQYSQLWIVDRIMTKGTIWTGRYVRSHFPVTLLSDLEDPALNGNPKPNLGDMREADRAKNNLEFSCEPLIWASRVAKQNSIWREIEKSSDAVWKVWGHFQSGSETADSLASGVVPKASTATGATSPSKTQAHTERSKSIIRKQLERKIISSIIRSSVHDWIDTTDGTAADGMDLKRLKAGDTVAYASQMTERPWSFANEQKRVLELVSVLDVDEPCIVATPYNVTWELLPRPSLRSMSVHWIVQPQHYPDGEAAFARDLPERLGVRYGHDGCHIKEPLPESYLLKLNAHVEQYPLTYRVVDKVRGMWRIMDWPSQRYVFV